MLYNTTNDATSVTVFTILRLCSWSYIWREKRKKLVFLKNWTSWLLKFSKFSPSKNTINVVSCNVIIAKTKKIILLVCKNFIYLTMKMCDYWQHQNSRYYCAKRKRFLRSNIIVSQGVDGRSAVCVNKNAHVKSDRGTPQGCIGKMCSDNRWNGFFISFFFF